MLSVCIPTLPERIQMFQTLWDRLQGLVKTAPFEIELIAQSGDDTTGKKRNDLIYEAKGDYVVFIDDDDQVSDDYFLVMEEGIKQGVDCIRLNGKYSFNGSYQKNFHCSLTYTQWGDETAFAYRPPCHLNPIKTSIMKRFPFQDTSVGEDVIQSLDMVKAKAIQTEYFTSKLTYDYLCMPKSFPPSVKAKTIQAGMTKHDLMVCLLEKANKGLIRPHITFPKSHQNTSIDLAMHSLTMSGQ